MLKLANENLTQYREIMKDSPSKSMKKQVKGLNQVVKEASRESSIKKISYRGDKSFRRDEHQNSTERSFSNNTPFINQSKSSLSNSKRSKDILFMGKRGSRNGSNQNSQTQISNSQVMDYSNTNLNNSVFTRQIMPNINDQSPNITPRDTNRSVKLATKKQLKQRKQSKTKEPSQRNFNSTNISRVQNPNNPDMAKIQMNIIQESSHSPSRERDDLERDMSNNSQFEYQLNQENIRIKQNNDYNTVNATMAKRKQQLLIPAIDMNKLDQTALVKDGKKIKKKKKNGGVDGIDQQRQNLDQYDWLDADLNQKAPNTVQIAEDAQIDNQRSRIPQIQDQRQHGLRTHAQEQMHGRNIGGVLNVSEIQQISGSTGPFETQRTATLQNTTLQDVKDAGSKQQLKVLEKHRIIPAKKSPRKKKKVQEQPKFSPRLPFGEQKAAKVTLSKKNPVADIALLKKQKQDFDAQIMGQLSTRKRVQAQEPQAVTKVTNLIGVAEGVKGAVKESETSNNGIEALGMSISNDTSAIADQGSSKQTSKQQQYRLPKLKKTQAQLKREFHQQEFKMHSMRLKDEQFMKNQENKSLRQSKNSQNNNLRESHGRSRTTINYSSYLANGALERQSQEYQKKIETQNVYKQSSSSPMNKIETPKDTNGSQKLIKKNKYANAYDSSSPYHQDSKHSQSIETVLGIHTQDKKGEKHQDSPKQSTRRSKKESQEQTSRLNQSSALDEIDKSQTIGETQHLVIRLSATASQQSHEKAPNTASFVDHSGNNLPRSYKFDKGMNNTSQVEKTSYGLGLPKDLDSSDVKNNQQSTNITANISMAGAGKELGTNSQVSPKHESANIKIHDLPERQQSITTGKDASVVEHEGGMNSTFTSNLGNSRLGSRVNKSNMDKYSNYLSQTNSARQRTRQEQQRDIDGKSKVKTMKSSIQHQNVKTVQSGKFNTIGDKQFTNISLRTGTINDSRGLESPQQVYFQNQTFDDVNQSKKQGIRIEASRFEQSRLSRINIKRSQNGSNMGSVASKSSQKEEPNINFVDLVINQTPKNASPAPPINLKSKRNKYAKHSSIDSSNTKGDQIQIPSSSKLGINSSQPSSYSQTGKTNLTREIDETLNHKITHEVNQMQEDIGSNQYDIKFVNQSSNLSESRQSSSHQQQKSNQQNQQIIENHLMIGSSLTKIPEEEQKIDYSNIYMGVESIQSKSRPATKGISKTDSVKLLQGPLSQNNEQDNKESPQKTSMDNISQAYFDIKQLTPLAKNKSSTSIIDNSSKSFQKLQGVNKLAVLGHKNNNIKIDCPSTISSKMSQQEILAQSSVVKSSSPFKSKSRPQNDSRFVTVAVEGKSKSINAKKELSKTQMQIEKEMLRMQKKLEKMEIEIYNKKQSQIQQRQDLIQQDQDDYMSQGFAVVKGQLLNQKSGNNSSVDNTSPKAQQESFSIGLAQQAEVQREITPPEKQVTQPSQKSPDKFFAVGYRKKMSTPLSNTDVNHVIYEASQLMESQESNSQMGVSVNAFEQQITDRTSKSQPKEPQTPSRGPITTRTIQISEERGMMVLSLTPKNKQYHEHKMKEIAKEKRSRQKQKKAVNKEIKRQNQQLRNNVQIFKQKLQTSVQRSKIISVFDKMQDASQMKQISKTHQKHLKKLRSRTLAEKSEQIRNSRSRSPRTINQEY